MDVIHVKFNAWVCLLMTKPSHGNPSPIRFMSFLSTERAFASVVAILCNDLYQDWFNFVMNWLCVHKKCIFLSFFLCALGSFSSFFFVEMAKTALFPSIFYAALLLSVTLIGFCVFILFFLLLFCAPLPRCSFVVFVFFFLFLSLVCLQGWDGSKFLCARFALIPFCPFYAFDAVCEPVV